jgi:murein DD-endopeptidase MepM/ murein hydrolase activator NlpD
MSDTVLRIKSKPMAGPTAKTWENDLKAWFKHWQIAYPLKRDGRYTEADRKAGERVLYGLGIDTSLMENGVTPELRSKVRHGELTDEEHKRYKSKQRTEWRDKLRDNYKPTGGTGNTYKGSPIPGLKAHQPDHATGGLPGYPAHDYMAPAGSPCVSPITGTVTRLSGHDPKLGPPQGPGGPLGWSVYIEGDGKIYFLTHLGSRSVRVGEKVKAGQKIGTVANYDKFGRPSHIHQGVHG